MVGLHPLLLTHHRFGYLLFTMLNLARLDPLPGSSLFNCLPDAIVLFDRYGNPRMGNQAAVDWLLPHLPTFSQIDPAQPHRLRDHHHALLEIDQLPLRRILAGETLENEAYILTQPPSGQMQWIALSGGPCPPGVAPSADIAGILSVRNLGTRGPQNAQFQRRSFQDDLTGLLDRSTFVDQVNQVLTEGRSPNTLALLFVDLNRFKEVNDNLGHSVGNQLLRALGQRLQQPPWTDSLIVRLGGDEFAVLLQNLTQIEEAITRAEQLRALITAPFHLQQQDISIDTSIGIAPGAPHYRHAEDWLLDAAAAMGQVKDLPNRHWCLFDGSFQALQSQRLLAETALGHALDRSELRLHYQPIVTINTQAIIGFEALVRWQHPKRGLLMPGEFIGVAEGSDLIIPLGWWVLEEACRQMQAWTERYPQTAHFAVSVNMSSKQFFQTNLVEKVQAILAKTGFDPHRLKLEITEGVLIDHSDSIIATLEQLREMGIRLAIDDFGTGYSSLSYLHRFPFDCLKIDRSFIENADQDFEKLEILQSVVRLAWNLGLDVVAEGVETHRHYAQLKALRCESGQGYLFSRPLPPETVEAMLRDDTALTAPIAEHVEETAPTP